MLGASTTSASNCVQELQIGIFRLSVGFITYTDRLKNTTRCSMARAMQYSASTAQRSCQLLKRGARPQPGRARLVSEVTPDLEFSDVGFEIAWAEHRNARQGIPCLRVGAALQS